MKCNNYFCIYWSNNSCILDKVSLDIMGICEECTYVNIDDNILYEQRRDQLMKLDEKEKNSTSKTPSLPHLKGSFYLAYNNDISTTSQVTQNNKYKHE